MAHRRGESRAQAALFPSVSWGKLGGASLANGHKLCRYEEIFVSTDEAVSDCQTLNFDCQT